MDLSRARDRFRDERDEEIGPPEREKQSADAANSRQKHAFDEQLPDDSAAARPERGAEGHFLPPNGGAGEEEVGDIRARDQEYAADGAEQDIKSARDFAHHVLAQGSRPGAEAGVGFRILPREPGRDGSQLSIGLRDANAWLETADPAGVVIAALFRDRFGAVARLRLAREGDEDLGRVLVERELKTGRHHPNYGARPSHSV